MSDGKPPAKRQRTRSSFSEQDYSPGPPGGYSPVSDNLGSPNGSAGFNGATGSMSTPGSRKLRTNSENQGSDPSRPLAVTCTYCRSRKIKCDNGKPSCNNCIKTSNACVYLTKQKPGLKAGSGETMMKRIELLEEHSQRQHGRLMELEEWRRALLSTPAFIPGGSNPTGPPSSTPSNHAISQGPTLSGYAPSANLSTPYQPQNSLFQDPQAAAAAAAAVRANSISMPMEDENMDPALVGYSYHGDMRGDPSPLDQSMMSHLGTSSSNHHGGFMGPPQIEPFWREGNSLPRDDIVLDLIDLFMRKIAPVTFFIHPDTIWQRPWNVVVHAIVTLAAGLSDDERLTPFLESIREASRNYVYLQSMAKTNIENMQALALVSLDVLASGKGPEHWSPLAMLSRVALNLDIWRESEDQSPTPAPRMVTQPDSGSSRTSQQSNISKTHVIQPSEDWKEDESRRRLFWFIYVLDRYTSASAGWDPAISPNVLQRRLPCADALWTGDEWVVTEKFMSPLTAYGRTAGSHAFDTLSPAAFLIEALDLMGRSHSLGTRPMDVNDIRDMDSRKDASAGISSTATRWYMDLQRHIGRVNDGGVMHPLNMLTHGIYHVTICKLQCFYAYPAVNPTGVIEPYASQCLASAQAICDLSQRAVGVNAHPASISPIFIWICWVGARVLFAHSCWEARAVIRPEFKSIVTSLSKMARHYGLAAEYVKLLLRAERRWQAMNADIANSPNSGGSTSMAVSVLLDLRRTAYGATNAAKGDETPAVNMGGDHGPMSQEAQMAHAKATESALRAAGLVDQNEGDQMAEFHKMMQEASAGAGAYQTLPLAVRSQPESGGNTPWSTTGAGSYGGGAGQGQPGQGQRLAFGSLDNYFDHLDIFGSSFGNGFGQ